MNRDLQIGRALHRAGERRQRLLPELRQELEDEVEQDQAEAPVEAQAEADGTQIKSVTPEAISMASTPGRRSTIREGTTSILPTSVRTVGRR